MIIGGEETAARGGSWIPIRNPATGQVIAEAPAGTLEDVNLAIATAKVEFEEGEWTQLPVKERARRLFGLADAIEDRTEQLSQQEAENNGRPVSETRAQIGIVPDFFRYNASLALTFKGETFPVGDGYHQYMNYAPIGVVGVMTPFNHPLLIAARGVAPALAAGNTVVLKPSELTPLTSIKLVELALESGIPGGALNVVNGLGNEAGSALAAHDDIARIEFTGGTEVGRKIVTQAAQRFGKATAELGGKTPVLIFEDADVADSAAGVAFAGFIAAGQSCIAGSRVMVHENIAEEFSRRLESISRQIRIGDPAKKDTQMGPLISEKALKRTTDAVEQAIRDGAELLAGGDRPTVATELDNGYWLQPTVLKVRPDSAIANIEVFGPVVTIETFTDESEAITRANSSQFGLGAAVWTRDIGRAHRTAEQLHAGMTWVNDHHRMSPSMPWGGFKQSGIGKQAGESSFRDFLEERSIIVRTAPGSPNWFVDDDTSRLN